MFSSGMKQLVALNLTITDTIEVKFQFEVMFSLGSKNRVTELRFSLFCDSFYSVRDAEGQDERNWGGGAGRVRKQPGYVYPK